MISLEEAWKSLQEALTPLGGESVEVRKALGRILQRDIPSPRDIPSEELAAIDGYALRGDDLRDGRTLEVLGVIVSGETWEGTVQQGQCLRIMTGAVLPRGADVVLPLEDTEHVRTGAIRGLATLPRWAHVRRRGQYARGGDRLLREGERVGPEELAILCGIGLHRVGVRRRPRVGVLATGSELVLPGGHARTGQVFATHGVYLQAMVVSEGGRAILMGPVPDHVEPLCTSISSGLDGDLLLTTGGTGGGDGDLLGRAMRALGAEVLFQGVRMRPGRTTALYRVARKLILALPGGVGAVQVGFAVLGRPAIRWLQGESAQDASRVQCLTEVPLHPDPANYRFLEARVRQVAGRLLTAPLPRGPKGGGLPYRAAQGWIEVPPGMEVVPPWSIVNVRLKGRGLSLQGSLGMGGRAVCDD